MSTKIETSKIEEIRKIYTENPCASKKEVSIKYGISIETLSRLLKKLGLKYIKDYNWCRRYTFDDTFFEKIDNEEKAYFLGFLYADGCISNKNSINLGLHMDDKIIIEKFKAALKSNHPIHDRIWLLDYGKKYGKVLTKKSLLRIGSKKMAGDLEKLGCFKQKTFKIKFPTEEQVPNHLVHHFIRGFFDGDGSVYFVNNKNRYKYLNVNITSTESMIDSLLKVFSNIGCTRVSKQKHRTSWERGIYIFLCRNNNDIMKIHEYMYKDATVFLERKKQKFTECELKEKITKRQEIINFIKKEFKNKTFTTLDCVKLHDKNYNLVLYQTACVVLLGRKELKIQKTKGRLIYYKNA